MEATAILARVWLRFRALAAWAQLSIGFVAAMVVVSPFASAAQQAAPPTVSTSTTGEVARDVPATVPVTTTLAVSTTVVRPAPAGVPAGDDVAVVRVIDGDTIVVSGDIRVRLIGVDTPEISGGAECFGAEATRYMNELLPPGTQIRLVYDVGRLDRFGRTLAYVYKLTDGVFVNLAVVRNGFAVQLTVPPNVAHAEDFRAAVAQARVADLGVWRDCQATTTPVPPVAAPTTRVTTTSTTPTTVAQVTTTTAPVAGPGCHASYAGACVPTGFSDVDCAGGTGNGPGYVATKRFRVVGPDVYGLDGNGDGIACQ